MIVSLLIAFLAAVGGHVVTPSDVYGGPVSVHSQPTPAPSGISGGVHTSDVYGGPVSAPNP